ncbi:hypothetical protein MVEN_02147800 [Mycena venus]|uniref:Uncharacterized protein n=1 Tax=Mycena venus TaxID=2733690 RepID=A0A8H6XAL0_9AGAR|nr:hypothetical protein MVEN_02147800 [Mycena venus]
MDDNMHAAPRESSAQSNPGIVSGTSRAALINNNSRDINMFGCTTTSHFTYTTTAAVPSGHQTVPVTLRIYGGVITVTPPSRLKLWATSRRDGSRYGLGRNTEPRNLLAADPLPMVANRSPGVGCRPLRLSTVSGALGMPQDFRMIPVGDIDLQQEIRLDNCTGFIEQRRNHMRVRRLHSAKIEGRNSPVTVAVYQGNRAKEEWQRDIEKYVHPSIVQIYAAASSKNIHAAIFHDDLVPFRQFVDLYYCHSPILTVNIYACGYIEFQAPRNYFHSAFQHRLSQIECTILVRRSTGRLCVDLVPGGVLFFNYVPAVFEYASIETPPPQGPKSLDAPNQEAIVIDSLTLDQYHHVCRWDLQQYRTFTMFTSSTINLGVVISCSSGKPYEDSVEIAFLSNIPISEYNWEIDGNPAALDLMQNGWTCYASTDVLNKSINLTVWSPHEEAWLSQANHIFSCFEISSNLLHDYVVLDTIYFKLTVSAVETDPPEGFLFLCPVEDFRTGPSSFSWPHCPAYWSLDPSGTERLGTEDALELGFPSIQFSTEISGLFWDNSVYDGLYQFHQGKGFDPNSRDIARHLGNPLYQLSNHVNAVDETSARVKDRDSDAELEDVRTSSSEIELAEPTTGDAEAESPDIQGGPAISEAFRFLMNVQLSLIFFLAMCWFCNQI